MVWRAVWLIRTSATRRVQRWLWPRLGWPEPTTAMASAAAGASGSSGARPQRTGGMVKGLAELLRMLGARCRARFRALLSAVTATTSPAEPSSRLRWDRGYRAKSKGGKREGRRRSSQRCRRGGQRARGGAGDDGRSPAISVARGGRRRRGRRSEASGVTWVGGDEEGGAAVLLEASARRGVAGGRGEQRRWRRLRSAREGERNRGGGELGRE